MQLPYDHGHDCTPRVLKQESVVHHVWQNYFITYFGGYSFMLSTKSIIELWGKFPSAVSTDKNTGSPEVLY